MHCATLAILAASIVPCVVESVPFSPQGGQLQRNRRRAIDYPLTRTDFNTDRQSSRRRKRSPYNVVQVDGSSTSSNTPDESASGLPTTLTVVQTVTQSATPSISREIVEITSILTQSQSPVTLVITTTVQHEVTAPIPEMTVTPSPEPQSKPQAAVEAGSIHTTIVKTILASPSPTTTQYYDDGLWHTYYPVKTFSTSTTSSPSAQALILKQSASATSSPVAATSGSSQPSFYHPKYAGAAQITNGWNNTRSDIYGLKQRKT